MKRQKQKSEEKIKVTAEIVIEIKEEVTQKHTAWTLFQTVIMPRAIHNESRHIWRKNKEQKP